MKRKISGIVLILEITLIVLLHVNKLTHTHDINKKEKIIRVVL